MTMAPPAASALRVTSGPWLPSSRQIVTDHYPRLTRADEHLING
jgi:hypothetical protein